MGRCPFVCRGRRPAVERSETNSLGVRRPSPVIASQRSRWRGDPSPDKKEIPFGVFLTGTLSGLTFCMGRQWREPLPACSFFCLDFLHSRYLRLCGHLLYDHFQRGNEVYLGVLGVLC